MVSLSWLEFIIIILASFRLTHLIVYDEITSFIRDPFVSVTYEENEAGQLVQTIEVKGRGLRSWIGKLLSCHWCTGIWSAALIVGIYVYLPAAFPVILVLAVAGAAAVIESKLSL